jgi:RNA polymerase sigma factor (sigma-70 family)
LGLSKTTNNELVKRIQNGVLPQASFKELVVNNQEQLYWQIRRLLKNHDDAEDVLQSVFIKIWKGIPKFRSDSEFSSWAYRIAYNESMTFIGKKKRIATIDDPSVLLDNKEGVEDGFSSEEIEKKLFKALDSLPDKQRLVFELRYFDEKSFAEISEITGTSTSGLKASYHIAQKKIKEILLSD